LNLLIIKKFINIYQDNVLLLFVNILLVQNIIKCITNTYQIVDILIIKYIILTKLTKIK